MRRTPTLLVLATDYVICPVYILLTCTYVVVCFSFRVFALLYIYIYIRESREGNTVWFRTEKKELKPFEYTFFLSFFSKKWHAFNFSALGNFREKKFGRTLRGFYLHMYKRNNVRCWWRTPFGLHHIINIRHFLKYSILENA